MRQCQIRIGQVDVVVEEHVDVERAGPPALGAHTFRIALGPVREREERVRIEVGLDRDYRVQVCALGRTTDGRGLVHARYGDHFDTNGCAQPVDRRL